MKASCRTCTLVWVVCIRNSCYAQIWKKQRSWCFITKQFKWSQWYESGSKWTGYLKLLIKKCYTVKNLFLRNGCTTLLSLFLHCTAKDICSFDWMTPFCGHYFHYREMWLWIAKSGLLRFCWYNGSMYKNVYLNRLVLHNKQKMSIVNDYF